MEVSVETIKNLSADVVSNSGTEVTVIVNQCANCSALNVEQNNIADVSAHERISTTMFRLAIGELSILDIFSYIYNIPIEELQNLLLQIGDPKQIQSGELSSVVVCQKCVHILADMYNLHCEFDHLSNPKSFFNTARDIRRRKSLTKHINPEYYSHVFDEQSHMHKTEIVTQDTDTILQNHHQPLAYSNSRDEIDLIPSAAGDEDEILTYTQPGKDCVCVPNKSMPTLILIQDQHLNELRANSTGIDCITLLSTGSVSESPSPSEYLPVEECLKSDVINNFVDSLEENNSTLIDCEVVSETPKKSITPDEIREFRNNVGMERKYQNLNSNQPTLDSHRQGSSFSCPECEKIFKLHSQLTKHLLCVHKCELEAISEQELSKRSIVNEDQHTLSIAVARSQDTSSSEILKGENPNIDGEDMQKPETNCASKHCDDQNDHIEKDNAHKSIHISKENIIQNLETLNPNTNLITEPASKSSCWFCSECDKLFPSNKLQCSHLNETKHKANGRVYKCYSCDSKFIAFKDLKKHLLEQHQEKLYMCEKCGKKFSNYRLLKAHLLVHSRDKPHKCVLCDKKFRRKSDLNSHMQIHSTERTVYTCDICQKQFSFLQNMKNHKIMMHPVMQEILPAVIFSAPNENIDSSLLQEPTNVESTDVVLENIDSAEATTTLFTATEVISVLNFGSVNIGQIDGTPIELSAIKDNEMMHTLIIHTPQNLILANNSSDAEEKTIPCNLCDRKFRTEPSMHRHKKECHVPDSKKFKCNHCDATFNRKNNLKRHLMRLPTNNFGEQLKCETCGNTFKNKETLKSHQSIHQGIVYTCPTCSKEFKRKYDFKRHIMLHLPQPENQIIVDCYKLNMQNPIPS